MKNTPFNPVIRHQTSRRSHWLRCLILVTLWLFVGLIVVANISFSLGLYSDDLVSLYLLLNLQPHAARHILMLIGWLLIVIPIFCGWRWHQLRKEADK
ncbi:hypothetical protein FC99_GL000644 [Levilactobacillus koreensis JCM 16448]|uniref:hypothetical protein n=1 Tax=Levilactobacillus koreensis TaxID=637971 RepID=UPI0006600F18|nr:hypothetical protein [Levilactobacillus koreensis]KRK88155.1 hypothetical protein FC99_GL000644 [Levilactobacillus koreensis JCM 16448]